MSEARPTVIVRVRPDTSPRRAAEILRWIRCLLPAAMLVVTQAPPPAPPYDDDVVSIDADDVESGPLSIAAALARRVRR
ncbi:MAG TPA: hypothetical protein VIW03_01745 [Anaeromyxobacter sp.]